MDKNPDEILQKENVNVTYLSLIKKSCWMFFKKKPENNDFLGFSSIEIKQIQIISHFY